MAGPQLSVKKRAAGPRRGPKIPLEYVQVGKCYHNYGEVPLAFAPFWLEAAAQAGIARSGATALRA